MLYEAASVSRFWKLHTMGRRRGNAMGRSGIHDVEIVLGVPMSGITMKPRVRSARRLARLGKAFHTSSAKEGSSRSSQVQSWSSRVVTFSNNGEVQGVLQVSNRKVRSFGVPPFNVSAGSHSILPDICPDTKCNDSSRGAAGRRKAAAADTLIFVLCGFCRYKWRRRLVCDRMFDISMNWSLCGRGNSSTSNATGLSLDSFNEYSSQGRGTKPVSCQGRPFSSKGKPATEHHE